MTSPYQATGPGLWDLLGVIYIACLLLAPLLVRWRWGFRAAMYWAGAEILIVMAISALVYVTLYPDWQPLPRFGFGFHTQEETMLLMVGMLQFQMFVNLTLITPATAVIGGAVLVLAVSALLRGWRLVRRRRTA
jgi:hypothetical protein